MLTTALAFGLRNWKPLAIGFALLALISWYTFQIHQAYHRGRADERAAARIEAAKRIQEMEKNDEAFRRLPARDRCIAFMRDSGLSIDNCN